MNRQNTKIKLVTILNSVCGINEKMICESKHLVDDLAMDSLDLIDTIFEVEDEFMIKIEGEQIKKVKTFGDMIDLVMKIMEK